MDTLTILLALATVGIPALTEAAVATTRLFGGTGAGGQHTYLRKAWLRKACGSVMRYTVVIGLGGMLVALATLITAEAADAAGYS